MMLAKWRQGEKKKKKKKGIRRWTVTDFSRVTSRVFERVFTEASPSLLRPSTSRI